MKKTVCIDLDGVLARYEKWQGPFHIGEPIPGAVYFTRELQKIARVVIFTTRTKADFEDRPQGIRAEQLAYIVREWLDRYGFAYDQVYTGQGKPIAAAYVDDRAVAVFTNPQPEEFGRAILRIEELLAK